MAYILVIGFIIGVCILFEVVPRLRQYGYGPEVPYER